MQSPLPYNEQRSYRYRGREETVPFSTYTVSGITERKNLLMRREAESFLNNECSPR